MNFKIEPTQVADCFLIGISPYMDKRGSLEVRYERKFFYSIGFREVEQENILVSNRGAIRGMHWQEGIHAQAKILNVIKGEIFDVVFDLRPVSVTYRTIATFRLTPSSPTLLIPRGCAHGLQGISRTSIVQYKTDSPYNASKSKSFRWNDLDAAIPWPIANPILSEMDSAAPSLDRILNEK